MKRYKFPNKRMIIILSALICCLLFGHVNYARAASSKKEAIKAYNEMVSSWKKIAKYFPDLYLYDSRSALYNCDYSIAYLDNDNIPELIFRTIDELYIFKYKKGKIVKLDYYEFSQLDQGSLDFGYYKKKGVFWVKSYFEGDVSIFYNKLKKGRVTFIGAKRIQGSKVLSYSINGKKVSKSNFDKTIAKKVGKTKPIIINNFKKLPAVKKK